MHEVGENDLQVITNNGSNYVLANKLLEGNLYWTLCLAHWIWLLKSF